MKDIENIVIDTPIAKKYAYHKPSEAALERITELRRWFTALEDKILAECDNNRERSIALTQLELAAMMAIKAVVLYDPESVQE